MGKSSLSRYRHRLGPYSYRRNEGIAAEAIHAAIDDLSARTDTESITAYIEEAEEKEPSRRLAAKLGFASRGPGRGRSGELMTVYELRRDVTRPACGERLVNTRVGQRCSYVNADSALSVV
jgi:RimJ/RimL family protein N-acetyltransferase